MYPQSLTRTPTWRSLPRRWLICLDLQRDYVVPGRPRYAPGNAAVAEACARVLGQARDESWNIVHSQVRADDTSGRSRELFDAPIEGLRPLITEPVFFRTGLSAFANPAFAAELRRARGDAVYLIGFSLADTCLATALAGVDAGLSLTLLEEAVGAGDGADAARIARTILKPFVRIRPSLRLESRRGESRPEHRGRESRGLEVVS
ncbi:MAG TPA: isochorismatase family protein [Caulobacteraceae bacterium]|jgi:nicotinamidase-related amidase|nr:isochorismatase family protein [Caulobacteraceae bacterium]